MQVQTLEPTLFSLLILGKSRFPPKMFNNINYKCGEIFPRCVAFKMFTIFAGKCVLNAQTNATKSSEQKSKLSLSHLGLQHACHHHLLRHVGNAIPSITRCTPHGLNLFVRVHGPRQRILRRPALQDPQGQGVEESRIPHGNPVPWNHLLTRGLHQLLHLGQAL